MFAFNKMPTGSEMHPMEDVEEDLEGESNGKCSLVLVFVQFIWFFMATGFAICSVFIRYRDKKWNTASATFYFLVYVPIHTLLFIFAEVTKDTYDLSMKVSYCQNKIKVFKCIHITISSK